MDAGLQADASAERALALVPAVMRAMAVLDLLAQEREALSLTQLATRLQLPKSSVHGLCSTLVALGYLRRYDDGSYFIGPGVMALAQAFIGRTNAAQEFASLWQELSAPPEETVILSVLAGTDVVYVGARNSERPLGLAFTVGMHLPAHLAASGKAMLAFRDEARVRELYGDARLPRFHGTSSMTVKGLLDELAEVRERGWSVDDEGVREGVYAFGAPVFDAGGEAVAGISLCIHKATLDAKSELRHRGVVIDIARRLTQRLGGTSPRAGRRRTHQG